LVESSEAKMRDVYEKYEDELEAAAITKQMLAKGVRIGGEDDPPTMGWPWARTGV
jgi:hypothetical protein